MTKRYYKQLKIAGKHFVNYAVCRTGILPVYKDIPAGISYAKTRNYGRTVNGIDNMIVCIPCVFAGLIKGYKEL